MTGKFFTLRPIRKRSDAGPRNHRLSPWLWRWVLAGGLAVGGLLGWAIVARELAPEGNTGLARFDAIIVLGSPADPDGNPTPEQLSRITEAVHEYERGVAPRLILTGSAVSNRFVEAEIMARAAHAQGVPAQAILVEPSARNTIENACFSARILRRNGWSSAEVISSPYHLPRAGLIFSAMPIAWRAHPAPAIVPQSAAHDAEDLSVEELKTLRYLIWARWVDACQP
ncbi:MAG: YdcF family protein [Terracidiphilus sp.]